MGDEIRDAVVLLSADPTMHGRQATALFVGGMEYRFRVRDGILVRLRFTFDPPRNPIVIRQMPLTRTSD